MSEILDVYLASLRPGVNRVHRSRPAVFTAWLEEHGTDTEVPTLDGKGTVVTKLTRDAVDRWIKVRERTYTPAVVRLEFGQIRRVFKTNGVAWPYGPREGPQVAQGDEKRPRMPTDKVTDLIEASGGLDPIHRALLAIATVFGTRRAEMMYAWNNDAEQYDGMGNDNFAWAEGLIRVDTVKAGRKRQHLIPPEIRPVLEAYDWSEPRSDSLVSRVNVDLRVAAGLGHYKGASWHAIRRRIVADLFQGDKELDLPAFTVPEVTIFMRWKPPSGSMPERYAAAQDVGEDGQVVQGLQELDEELDRRAFALNPWLEDWKRIAGGISA